MKVHTDEPLTDGTRARWRKEPMARRGLLSRKGMRRCGIGAAVLSVAALLLSSCEAYVAPTSTPVDKLSTGDAVMAVWMREGRSVSGLGKPTYDSGIGLLDEEGNVDLSFIDERTVGDLAWTQRGLSYSEENNEFLTTRARLIGRWNISAMSSPMGESQSLARRGTGVIESTPLSSMEP